MYLTLNFAIHLLYTVEEHFFFIKYCNIDDRDRAKAIKETLSIFTSIIDNETQIKFHIVAGACVVLGYKNHEN